VRLTAAGRAALRGRRTLVADAVVSDLGRGTVTRTTLTAG
jgi:hypothetical protein